MSTYCWRKLTLTLLLPGPRLSGGHSLHETSSVLVETVSKSVAMGSPFASLPKFSSDASKVISRGAGLSKAFIGQKNTFTVDCSKAGDHFVPPVFRESQIWDFSSPLTIFPFFSLQAQTCWWSVSTGRRHPARKCTSNTWATGCTMSHILLKSRAATSSLWSGETRTSPAVRFMSQSLKTELFTVQDWIKMWSALSGLVYFLDDRFSVSISEDMQHSEVQRCLRSPWRGDCIHFHLFLCVHFSELFHHTSYLVKNSSCKLLFCSHKPNNSEVSLNRRNSFNVSEGGKVLPSPLFLISICKNRKL